MTYNERLTWIPIKIWKIHADLKDGKADFDSMCHRANRTLR